MKKRLMPVAFYFCLITLISPLSALQAQPKLKASSTMENLGTLYDGARKTAAFTLTNVGKDTLKLFKVTTSCGCTTLEEKPDYILPGKSWKMEVELNSTGLKGEVQKSVSLLTNEPGTESTHRFSLKANVISEFELLNKQDIVQLGEFILGGRAKRSAELKNITNEAILIMKTRFDNEQIEAIAENKIVEPGETLEVTFDFSISEVGTFTDVVYLVTSSMNQQYVPVKLTYTVVARQ
ncbi:DUF1573 domain-containing protein [Chloroherpeton thalassium]|nr:DUF1573 domain-containing protein [Chloroherpeton thalassium]